MSVDKSLAALLTVVLVASAAAPAAAVAQQDRAAAEAYSGSHVSFGTTSNAVVNYSVNGATVFESMKIQSKSAAQTESGIDIGGDLGAVTGFAGAAVSVQTTATASATVTTESGASMTAHDNNNGIVVVRSSENSQYVAVNVSSETTVESSSEGRVVVTTQDGTTGTFLVVGDGSVTVNEDGNVSAELSAESKLVFRCYSDGRDEADKTQERLIAEGKATASVYVMQSANASGETVVDVVNYGQDTSVEVTQRTESSVTMTAERSQSEGKIIIASVSDAVIESTDDMQVTVSGNTAVRASSYTELENAIGGDTSKFMVQQESSAEATADLLVSVNHFSERQIKMQDSGSQQDTSNGDTTTADGDTNGGDDTTTSGDGGPGFTAAAALAAVIATAIAALRRA